MVSGVRRGACPECLGPARAVYSRVDLLADGTERGSYAVRGLFYCIDSKRLVSVRGGSLAVPAGRASATDAGGACAVCRATTYPLYVLVQRVWTELVGVETCSRCRMVQNRFEGAELPIPSSTIHASVSRRERDGRAGWFLEAEGLGEFIAPAWFPQIEVALRVLCPGVPGPVGLARLLRERLASGRTPTIDEVRAVLTGIIRDGRTREVRP